MKQYILISLIVFLHNQAFCSKRERAPASISELEANYRKHIKDAAKNETVVVSYVLGERKYRLEDDRSWEKRWNEIQAERKARRIARRKAELKQRELLATGKYYDDGRGNIRLKKEFRNESLVNVEQTEENSQAVFVFSGTVKRVVDGDTILVEGRKIRLRGIDAPEMDQPFGKKAAGFLNSLVCGKGVRVEYSETYKYDKDDRILGTVYLQETDINLTMVRNGFAWHYKQYDDTKSYADAEDEARAAKKGLWMVRMPIPPWDYRRKANQKGEYE